MSDKYSCLFQHNEDLIMKKWLPQIFQSADSRFHLRTSLIIAFVPFIPLLFLGFMTWVSMNTTFNFFKANGLKESELLSEAFSDFILSDASTYFPYVAIFFIAVFFTGNYLCHLALRPFKKIGDYATNSQKNVNLPWEMDAITNKKIVCQFGHIFFKYLSGSRINNEFISADVEEKYKRIKTPIADKVFYFHYFVFVGLITSTFVFGMHLLSSEIHEGFVNFALSIMKTKNQGLSTFLISQEVLFNSVTFVSAGMVVALYVFVAKNLIASVDGVSYHFLRVMREIISGNFQSRVRLRVNDPGQQCAVNFNKLLDDVLPKKVPEELAVQPPPFPENLLPMKSGVKKNEFTSGKYGLIINCVSEDELQEMVKKLKAG